jgi:alpha-2-macroglobulin
MFQIFRKQQISTSLFILLLAVTGFFACGKKDVLRAKGIPEAVKSYVYAYTAGVISKSDPVRVRFAGAAITADKVGSEADNILDFKPSVSGKAIWEDDHTVRFDPEDGWENGTAYIATVSLSEVFDNLPEAAKSFEFDFIVREQALNVEVFGIEAEDPTDLKKQLVKGAVYVTDKVKNEDLEKVLTAEQAGKALPISWEHDSDGLTHLFTIGQVTRGYSASEVKVAWNGKPIDQKIKDETKMTIPALGDFSMMSARVIQNDNQFVVLHFSDPLLPNQDLSGLIGLKGEAKVANAEEYYDQIPGTTLNFTIDGNKINVYPSQRLAGKVSFEVRPGIKNIAEQRMEKPTVWQVDFEPVRPMVRLVGRGVILPSSESGLVLPFEAVSLDAVEIEIFKIYDNNILQFLQTNELDGNDTWELQRVGRVIKQQMVPLKGLNPKSNAGVWTRYALDLSKLFKADPNAIYQVRIGFRPEYAMYKCSNRKADDNLKEVSQQSNVDENGDIISFWGDNYYGMYGYYEGFEWRHRTDPCFPAYYNNEHFAQTNVFASDLGITAKGGNDNAYFVAVADLRTTESVGDVELEFYDYQQQLISTAKTNGEGIAEVKLERKPFLIIAKKEKMKGYLKTADGNSLSLSRFDVAGEVTQKGLKGFLYGDRGVWRPGDSLFLNFVLEDKDATLPDNYPIAFELMDSRGQVQYKTVTTKNVQNLYALPVATSTDAPTGNWTATVKAGGAVFTKNIKVETVKPNRLKIDLDFGKKELSAKDEPAKAKIQVDWLHGAPGSNLKTVVEAEVSQVTTTFPKHPGFQFDDPARRLYYSEPVVIFDGMTNSAGTANLNATIYADNKNAPGKLNVNLRAKAFEKGGDFSIYNSKIPYSPYRTYAGVSMPKNSGGENRLDIGKDGTVQVVSVDENGVPQIGKNLTVGLYRVEWRWWWDQGDDFVSQFNSTNHFNAISSEGVVTNAQGKANYNVNVNGWGRYMVRVCDTESGHCTGDFFYAGYPWYGDEGSSIASRQEAAMMTFTASKEKYKVGEDIEITVPAGDKGRVLITLETGTKVIKSMWKDAKQGENKFKFKATEEMSPTVYAHVSLLQPHGQVKNDLPIRMYGVLAVDVEDPKTLLKPVIKTADELKPEQVFTVEVSEANNEDMAYTIAVVDEGLLGLTNFKTPDPHGALYAREALGVKTWDLYDYVLGAFGGELERILAVGGDGEINAPMERKNANRFKPVVMHAGPFLVTGGKKKHTFKMPNYVGSVRVMVVAANSDAAYGNAEKVVPVKKPLMALATLPRVLGPGETLKLPVSIFAMDNKVKSVDVSLAETTGLVNITGGATRNLNFAKQGEDMTYFDLKVGEKTGIAKFKITAKGGGEIATQEIELDVRNPNPYVTRVSDGMLQGGGTWSQSYKAFGTPGSNTGILEVSAIPPLKLGERLKYLLQYPHGCIEQITSGAFPQLYVDKLTKLDAKQKAEVTANITAAIDKLKNFQMASGAFTYWPGNDYDAWGTNYAGHFLLEAKAAGYKVPDAMIDRFVKFQQVQAKRWNPDTRGNQYSWTELDQAYRLYTLALAKKAETSSMNRMRELKNLSNESRWRLAAAYAQMSKQEIGKELVKNLPTTARTYDWWGYTYGSTLRDEAMILETQVLLGDMTNAAANLRHVAESLSNEQWYSTQTTAYALMAIGKFAGKSKVSEEFRFSYDLGDGKVVNAGSSTPVMQINVPLNGSEKTLTVKNSGAGILFTRLILTGQPLVGDATATANNLKIEVNYMTPNGTKLNPAAIPQGTDFVAEVVVTNPGTRAYDLREMALTQIFPSGWEIINARLFNFTEFANTNVPEYQDIRDDRVLTYFDIPRSARQVYRVRLNAAYLGRYYLPTVGCEAMYDHTISATKPGMWVEVVGGEKSL